MKINTVKEQNQSVLSSQNKIGLHNNEFKEDIKNVINNYSRSDEYVSLGTVNKALSSDIYNRNSLGSALNSKMPISKYLNNGILTLTDNNLLYTPYEEGKKGWNKSIFNQKEYEMVLGKMEENNSLEIQDENYWMKNLEGDLVPKSENGGGADSNIVVNADGSRSLVITMKIGGAETTMCIEISKPTKFQNSKGSPPNEENLKETDLNVEQNLGEIISDVEK